MAGRRTKLNPDTQARIVAEIGRGVWDYVAAQVAGVDKATFYRWMERGEKGEPMYREFCADVSQARAKARAMREAAVAQVQPLAWLRMGPGRDRPGEPGWTDAQRTEITGPEGAALQFTLVIQSPKANGTDVDDAP